MLAFFRYFCYADVSWPSAVLCDGLHWSIVLLVIKTNMDLVQLPFAIFSENLVGTELPYPVGCMNHGHKVTVEPIKSPISGCR